MSKLFLAKAFAKKLKRIIPPSLKQAIVALLSKILDWISSLGILFSLIPLGSPLFIIAKKVNQPLMWKSVHWLIDTRIFINISVLSIEFFQIIQGENNTKKILENFYNNFVLGWPIHSHKVWINIHFSQLFWQIKSKLKKHEKVSNKLAQKSIDRSLRVGCFGKFSGILSFPKWLFEAFPNNAELFVFDIQHQGKLADYLQSLAAYYNSFNLNDLDSYQLRLKEIATIINGLELDILLNINWKQEAYDLLDALETPCIIHICTGSDLLHHQKVSFQIYCQPESDYFVRGKYLFCGASQTLLKTQLTYPGYILYDCREIDFRKTVSWNERESLIVFHGSLYKLASLPFLGCIFKLIEADSALEFVFMGKDNGSALSLVNEMAARRGLKTRVHYEGEFSAMRDEEGCVSDPGWLKMLMYLKRARLAPNPWPIGGGSSRFESYAAGVPCIHMGVNFKPASWGRPQHGLLELPDLLVPAGTATSIEQYEELCRQCLYNGAFAKQLVKEQLKIVRKLSDPEAYWQQIFGFYQDWLENDAQLLSG